VQWESEREREREREMNRRGKPRHPRNPSLSGRIAKVRGFY
jgi:hypothetical protein